ncbi:MAG: VIT1/CCC1 transporter family protein [Dehalococcoidia bacterium]
MQSTQALDLSHEAHRGGTWLRDVILGGQDGLVNVLEIALGVSAAGATNHILVAAALAATFAESISMGAVAYTSSLAQRDHYQSELARERREMVEVHEEERNEIRQIYSAKGFHGELLERIVETITGDDDTWLSVMMSEELGLQPVDTNAVLRTSVIVTIAAVIGSLIPLIPFLLFPGDKSTAVILALALSAAALFGVGAYKARTLVGDWRTSGIQMVAIGIGAALVGFLVGRIFHTTGA